jgi:bifunctional enzyme CysN/CysC
VPFDAYRDNRDTGGFILIDRLSNSTVGAGMLHFALRRAHNIHLQALDVDKAARAALMGQKPACCGSPGCRAPARAPSPTR